MTARSPHPQRCETCRVDSCKQWPGSLLTDVQNGYLENLVFSDKCTIRTIAMVGCASHSSSPAAAPVPEGTSKLCFGTIDLRWDSCQACNEIETCQQKQRYLDFDKQQAAAEEREKVLNEIEQYLCSCVWSNAPDCPGQSNGECICDGCERFEYPFPEDAREYIKSLRREGEQHG